MYTVLQKITRHVNSLIIFFIVLTSKESIWNYFFYIIFAKFAMLQFPRKLCSLAVATHSYLFTNLPLKIIVPGGLSLREGQTLLEDCYETGCLRALDLVEVNPALAFNHAEKAKTLEAAKRLILAATGYYRGGMAPIH